MIRLGGGWKIHKRIGSMFVRIDKHDDTLPETNSKKHLHGVYGYTILFSFGSFFLAYFQGSNLLLVHRELGFFSWTSMEGC